MRVTQTDTVLNILNSGKSITSMEAFDLGITRLSAIIFTLRRRGYNIISEDCTCVTRYGAKAQYCSYRLVKEE